MTKLLKLIKSLMNQGFATAEQKSEVLSLSKELAADEQEVVKEDVEAVEALPEEVPTDDDEDAAIEKSIKTIVKTATKSEVKSAVEGIKSEIKEWLDSQKDAMSKKAGIYHPEAQDKRKALNAYFRDFANGLLNNDINALSKVSGNVSVKEMTTDATGTPYGGYVVSQEFTNEIRYLAAQYGVARREMTTVQLSKNAYEANSLVTDVTVYWVDEGGVIPSTQIVLGHTELKLKKLAAIVALTRELLQDSEVDLFAFIGERVAQGFAKAEDMAFFIGDGTPTYGSYTGIVTAATQLVTTASTTFVSATADNLLDLQDAVLPDAQDNGKYYGNRTVRSIFRKMKDTTGQYIYSPATDESPATFFGKPWVDVEAMLPASATGTGKRFVMFGDLRKACILGYKGAISADRFNAGVVRNVANSADINLITTDREAIRWVERVGMVNIMLGAVAVLKTA